MKALSLWQPWASLVAMGEKKVETRIWPTHHRGLLAIHSTSKTPPAWLGQSRMQPDFLDQLRQVFCAGSIKDTVCRVDTLPRGKVLCIVNLVSVMQCETVRDDLSEQERIFGNYEAGRYAWFFEMVERFETPIPAKGNRMLWEWKR